MNLRSKLRKRITTRDSNIRLFDNSIISHPGFTLIELLVVVGMIAVILGALTVSVNAAQTRARVQRATSDVKAITQAILSYEVWNGGQLETKGSRGSAGGGVDANMSSLGFLLGKGSAKGVEGGKGASGGSEGLPVLLMAQLKSGGAMVDPWGMPYKVTIAEKNSAIKLKTVTGQLKTGYWLPNFYRIGEGER